MKNLKIFLTFTFLISLFLLILNDHYLKNNFPSLITGKLSDFTGLIVLPVVLFVIFQKFITSEKRISSLLIFIGISFILWKTMPVEILFYKIQNYIFFPLPGRVKDPTDLIALISLFISFKIIRNYVNSDYPLPNPVVKILSYSILVIASTAVIATSPAMYYSNKSIDMESKKEKEEMLFLLEQTFIENGFEIESRQISDSNRYVYEIRMLGEGRWTKEHLSNSFTITFLQKDKNLFLLDVQGAQYFKKNEQACIELIEKKILQPVRAKLKE